MFAECSSIFPGVGNEEADAPVPLRWQTRVKVQIEVGGGDDLSCSSLKLLAQLLQRHMCRSAFCSCPMSEACNVLRISMHVSRINLRSSQPAHTCEVHLPPELPRQPERLGPRRQPWPARTAGG